MIIQKFQNVIIWIVDLFNIDKIKRISYRQDINGLRAVAVLSVVIYHSDIGFLKGGWLGVDIFFVISGYLISNIIVSELNENKFSLKNFYRRRAIRILPALFTTILITIPLAFWLLTPKALDEYIKSIIASSFFYSNYYFQNLDFYIAESTKYMPFLHTWSLAIEEQFYILFPLVSIILYKKINKNFYIIFFIFVSIFSIFLNLQTQEVIKFYQLQFRIWELLLGVILMILSFNLKISHLEKIGIPMLLFPIFYFDDSWINDIEPKLISLIGVSLIIFSNKSNSFLSKILGNKVFSVIGLSSFSIYLLHQPLFAFSRIYFTQKTWKNLNDIYLSQGEILFTFLLIFIFGFLNYFFVERYFLKKKSLLGIFAIAIMVLVLNVLFKSSISNDVVYSNKLYDYTVDIKKYTAKLDGVLCHDQENFENLCSFNENQDQKVILLGDSHARELGFLLSQKLSDFNFQIISGNSCLFLLNKEYYKTCPLKIDDLKFKKYIENTEDAIFIYTGDIWDDSYNSLEINESIPRTFDKIIKSNNSIIVIEQIPVFPFSVPEKINDAISKGYIGFEYEIWKLQKSKKPQLNVYRDYSNKNFYTINPENYICNKILQNLCIGAIGENLYYRDDNHLTIDGVNLFLDELLSIINSIDNKN